MALDFVENIINDLRGDPVEYFGDDILLPYPLQDLATSFYSLLNSLWMVIRQRNTYSDEKRMAKNTEIYPKDINIHVRHR